MKRVAARLRWPLYLLIAFGILVGCFYGYTRWSGNRDWNEAVARYESFGGTLDLDKFVPDPIPADQNYAAIPFLRGITIPDGQTHPSGLDGEQIRARFDSKFEILEPLDFDDQPDLGSSHEDGVTTDLKPWEELLISNSSLSGQSPPASSVDPADKNAAAAFSILVALDSEFAGVFSQSDAATSRPFSRWNPPVSDFYDHVNPAFSETPHIVIASPLIQVFHLRACAAVRAGKSEIAANSILAILRISQAEAPFSNGMLPFAYAAGEFQSVLAALWEGLDSRIFDDATLLRLQEEFAAVNSLQDCATSLRSEAIFLNKLTFEKMKGIGGSVFELTEEKPPSAFYPTGWYDSCRAFELRRYQDAIAALEKGDTANLKQNITASAAKAEELSESGARWRFLGMPDYLVPICVSAVRNQAYARIAEAASALERHYLVQGTYPDSLQSLVPKFISKIPEDPVDRKPLRYQRTKNGRYLLYSIGWNQMDDSGKKEIDREKGDWVWTHTRMKMVTGSDP